MTAARKIAPVSDIRWRSTRLLGEDRERLMRATVEETATGWRWSVYKGTSLEASGGVFSRLSKDEAVAEASVVMRGERR